MDRSPVLSRMLNSLALQSAQPAEIVIVDASNNALTEQIFAAAIPGLQTQFVYRRAQNIGAAVQRNEAISHTSYDNILFLDDDIVFEPDCIARLWWALQSDARMGGVSATIINQKYLPPGGISEAIFRFLHGRSEKSYAGRCIGPALNLLPEDSPDLPNIVPVEWLNTTCTLYRKAAMPNPPFSNHFVGYSFMEDVALSLTVAEDWKLANARTARICHDSQPGKYKDNKRLMAKMELVNRHYIMSRILARTHALDYMKLALLEVFGITTSLTSARAWGELPSLLIGKASGVVAIVCSPRESSSKSAALVKENKPLATE
jgi:glycosyltransferase involved in cell wall biosynthesis